MARNWRRLLSHCVSRVGSLALLLTVWSVAALFTRSSFLPGPLTVFHEVVRILVHEQFLVHMAHTLHRVLAGMALAFSLSLLFGIPMGLSRGAERFLEAYILVGLTVPGLCWAVLSLMWFGIANTAPIFAITVTVFPLITTNIWQGTKALDKELADMGKAFRASRGMIIRQILLPQLLPFMLAALRFGFSLAWKVVVLSEMLGLSNGIGYMINTSFASFSMTGVLAWTLSFTAVMFVIEFGIFKPMEGHLTRWRPVATI